MYSNWCFFLPDQRFSILLLYKTKKSSRYLHLRRWSLFCWASGLNALEHLHVSDINMLNLFSSTLLMSFMWNELAIFLLIFKNKKALSLNSFLISRKKTIHLTFFLSHWSKTSLFALLAHCKNIIHSWQKQNETHQLFWFCWYAFQILLLLWLTLSSLS